MAIRNRLQCEFYANLLSAKNDVTRGGSAGSTARPYLSSYSSIHTRVPGTAVLKPTKFSTAALNLVVNAYMYCSTNRTRRTGYYSCSTYLVLNLVYACHTGCTSVIQRIDSDGLCACARASCFMACMHSMHPAAAAWAAGMHLRYLLVYSCIPRMVRLWLCMCIAVKQRGIGSNAQTDHVITYYIDVYLRRSYPPI